MHFSLLEQVEHVPLAKCIAPKLPTGNGLLFETGEARGTFTVKSHSSSGQGRTVGPPHLRAIPLLSSAKRTRGASAL